VELKVSNPNETDPSPSEKMTLRYLLFRVLFETPDSPRIYFALDRFITMLILASAGAILLEHIESLHAAYHWELALFDQITVIFFTAEYILRLLCGGIDQQFVGKRWKTLRYAITPFALLDFIVVVPFYLTFLFAIDLRVLRLLRLLRVFKLARVIVPKWRHFQELNRGRTVRQKLYSVLEGDHFSGEIQHLVDVALVTMIFLSVLAVVLESVADIHAAMEIEFHYFDLISVAVFSTEYVLRVYVSVENSERSHPLWGRLAYMVRPSALVDLVAVLPFYLTFFIHVDLRFMRVMRLLRILKLTRYSLAMTTIIEVVTEEMPSLSAAFFMLLLIMIFAASGIFLVEHDAQPDKFSSIPMSMYWAVVTLTTIGYGDMYPVTPIGQFMTMILACVGLGMIALPTGILATGFSEKLRKRAEEFKKLVADRSATGFISKEEQEELDNKARFLGLSTSREKQFETEEFESLGIVKTAETPGGLSLSFRSHDALEGIAKDVDQLSDHDKSVLMALIAVSLSKDKS
jgi:voltage-gated potassium channel